jgi:hypothetical protein
MKVATASSVCFRRRSQGTSSSTKVHTKCLYDYGTPIGNKLYKAKFGNDVSCQLGLYCDLAL